MSIYILMWLQGSCGPYIELGKAYAASNTGLVKETVRNRMETFITVSADTARSAPHMYTPDVLAVCPLCAQDGNFGIIKRLESQLVQHAVQRLTLVSTLFHPPPPLL